MFTGQLIWNEPSDLASQPAARRNVANGENPEAAFGLLYAEALDLAGEQDADIDTNINDAGGLPANEDYGGPGGVIGHALNTKRMPGKPGGTAEETWQSLLLEYNLMTLGSRAGEQHFAGKEHDADSHPYSSAMLRFMSQNRAAQVEPAPSSMPGFPPGLDRGPRLLNHPSTALEADVHLALPASSAASLNKSQLAHWMDAHALSRSSHHCAMYCRLGMEAAGLSTQDRPASGDAGDYGPYLLRHGAQVVPPDCYAPQVGDTVVFDKTRQHPYGHIELYDGQTWVSDFMQHGFSPYSDAASTPPFTIYRLT
jgi:hypothetical protein